MPIGFEGSGGVQGGFEALANLIAIRKKDELLRQKQVEQQREFDLQQQQLQEQAAYREAGQEETRLYHRATLQQRADELRAAEENRKVVEARALRDDITNQWEDTGATQGVTAQEYARAIANGVPRSMFTPNAIPSIDVAGATEAPAPQTFNYAGGTRWQQRERDAKDRITMQEDRQRHDAEMRALVAAASSGRGLNENQLFAATERLSGDWERATKPAKTISQSMGSVKVGLDALDRGDRPVASRTLVFAFNKLLDSISVVREGEVIATERAASLDAQVRGMLQQLSEGGSRLPDDELRKLGRISLEIGNELKGALDLGTVRKRIGSRAVNFKVNPDLIFGEDKYGLDEAPVVPPPAQDAGAPTVVEYWDPKLRKLVRK